MSIPLVQNNEKDSINTSIIAIKRNIERINMLLGLVDSGSPDLSGLATKQELEDAITQVETDLAPVDEVTSGNMHSVTSNAVSKANSYSENETFTGRYWTNGKKIYRKVYNLTSTTANMRTNLSSITNAETVITLRGMAIMRDFIMPIPWGDSDYSTTWCGYITMSPNTKMPYLYIMTSGYNSYPFNVIVIVEYTKTTD